MTQSKLAFSLFWRTYALLVMLLLGGVFAWLQALRELDIEPRAVTASAQQMVTVVQLSGEVLRLSDRANRPATLKALTTRQGLVLQPRSVTDTWATVGGDSFLIRLQAELRSRLGGEVLLATAVNDKPAVWLGVVIDREAWWLALPPVLLQRPADTHWEVWLTVSIVITLLGSVLIARRINQPLRDLSSAASRFRGGEFDSRLDETTVTSEIREVNMGFNRMARELAKVEEDRAVMLAGISHDLRTPLARLRLETEMSVGEEEARINMASDIDQLDAIIDKFMDYARPGATHLRPVLLSKLIDKEAASFRDPSEIRITSRVAIDLEVLADEVELARVFANLFENARRYGRTTDTGIAMVSVSCVRTSGWAICTVRDQGPGVAPEKLGQLTTPFFRGDAARTAATGAGLGLAIVDKSMQRMGGQVEFANADSGGLVAHLRLRLVRTARG